MRIKAKICSRLNETRKLNLSNPVSVYFKTLADEYILKKRASENFLGDAILFHDVDGLRFEMLINDQKQAGHDLLNAGPIACRSFFDAAGRKIGMDGLSQALNNNQIPAVIPLAIVLDDALNCDAGSNVEILS